ncbi:MAG: hypothetical protein KAQ81_10585 [Deltaproteobacteria bacterium]|nr:hypothetical protein [Deltaproteobacteria bacterium]
MPAAIPTIQTEKNTLEFFHKHVKNSIKNQHIKITEISEHYLVHLLADFTLTQKAFRLTGNDNRPLALIYHQAQFETANNKIKIFKELGDFSLFITGFLPDSLNRKVTDVDYYISLGRSAYENLSTILEQTHKSDFNLLFLELAEKFVAVTDILAEISSESFTQWNDGILRLYERWLKTRSKRDERLLFKKGIIPNQTLKHNTIQ